MIRLLRLLIFGKWNSCNHRWKIIDKLNHSYGRSFIGYEYVLQCDKCGNIKRKRP